MAQGKTGLTAKNSIDERLQGRLSTKQKYRTVVVSVVATLFMSFVAVRYISAVSKVSDTLLSQQNKFAADTVVVTIENISTGGDESPKVQDRGVNETTLSEMMTNNTLPSLSQEPPQCNVTDISNYTKKWRKPKNKGRSKSGWKHCLSFQCLSNQAACDNFDPTNFEGPLPPCCNHILRDLSREFERIMCYLGIEYFVAFGTLLGLTRSDRMIPWTSDNDYIMTKPAVAALLDLWDTAASHLNHGVGFHIDVYYRMCATPSFAGGKLLRWKWNETKKRQPKSNCPRPYSDIFWADELNETMLMDAQKCYHNVSSLRPAVRRAVYNGTFYQSFPANPDAILTEFFGPSWRIPDAKKKRHGNTHCGNRRKAQQAKQRRREREMAQQSANKTDIRSH